MTSRQLESLIRAGMRQVTQHTARLRRIYQDPVTMRIQPRAVAYELARSELWLAKARKAVPRPASRMKGSTAATGSSEGRRDVNGGVAAV